MVTSARQLRWFTMGPAILVWLIATQPLMAAAPQASNEAREVERFVEQIVSEIDAEQKEYSLELQTLHWSSILDPERIGGDKNLAKSRAMLKQASAIVSKHEAESAALVRDIRSRIGKLSVSDDVKEEMVSRFDRCVIYARSNELWALRKQALTQVGKIFDMLASSKRGVDWKVEKGELLFAKGGTASAKYNSLRKEIDRIIDKQDKVRDEGDAMYKRWVKEKKEQLKDSAGS